MTFPAGKLSRASSCWYFAPAVALLFAIAGAIGFPLLFPASAQEEDPQFNNSHCEGKPHNDTDIWVEQHFTDSDANRWHNLIKWNSHPSGTRGIALYRADAGETRLRRKQSGYWNSDYTGPIVKQDHDSGADSELVEGVRKSLLYWYQIAWIGANWESGQDTIIACSSIVNSNTGETIDPPLNPNPPNGRL